MSKDIIVSEKYGVNPSVSVCFWCGKDKEIIFFGKLKNDVEAPSKVVLDYVPCEHCNETWKKGVVLIEVEDTPQFEDQLKISKDLYPTGYLWVIKEEAFERMATVPIPETKIFWIDKQTSTQLGLARGLSKCLN